MNNDYRFTFQYGATATQEEKEYKEYLIKNLHSNMELLLRMW